MQKFLSFPTAQALFDAGLHLSTDYAYDAQGQVVIASPLAMAMGAIPAPDLSEIWDALPGSKQLRQGSITAWVPVSSGHHEQRRQQGTICQVGEVREVHADAVEAAGKVLLRVVNTVHHE